MYKANEYLTIEIAMISHRQADTIEVLSRGTGKAYENLTLEIATVSHA
jgi:hypothetical protein